MFFICYVNQMIEAERCVCGGWRLVDETVVCDNCKISMLTELLHSKVDLFKKEKKRKRGKKDKK